MLIGFEPIIEYIKKNKIDTFEKDIYEFGVCTGGGAGQILEAFSDYGIMYSRFFGFDSWVGLPEETEGLWNPEIWKKGSFSAEEYLTKDKNEIVPYLLDYFKKYTHRPVDLVSGFYEDTLTLELCKEKQFKPALFVSMDVDIHKSCLQALDYMIYNNLIVKGTIIRYDDWGDFTSPIWKGAKEYTIGESLAHKEIEDKYNLKFKTIYHANGVKIVVLK